MHLPENVRAVREERDMSQRQLADDAEISTAYMSQIESGTKLPSLDVLERLAFALEVEPGQLLDAGLAAGGMPDTDAVHGARALVEIEQVVRTPIACVRLVASVREYLDGPLAERLGAYRPVVVTLADVLEEFAHGRYRSLSGSAIVVIVAALSYVVDPDDVWPDAHPNGYVDDLAVLAFTRALVATDLDDFRTWRERSSGDSA